MAAHDHITRKQNAFSAAKSKIEPPSFVQLNAEQRVYFDAIVSSKAPSLWGNDVQLITASNLAKCFDSIDKLRAIVDKEGEILTTATTVKPHPAFIMLDQKIAQSVMLSRALQIHAAATSRSNATVNRNLDHQKSKQIVDSILLDDDDDLLAK